MKHSKDIADEVAAENAILAIDDPKELQAFIRGEQRESLLSTAVWRINALKSLSSDHVSIGYSPKQGEQPGPITRPAADFKTGIQGTKDLDVSAPGPRPPVPGILTAADVAPAIDAADLKRAQDAERADLEAQKAAEEGKAKPKSIITGEDVLKSMRSNGVKI